MTETSTQGPRVTADQMRDIGRLRRPKDDRMVAGVAAGLGRHLDIDPIILRVVFGALTIFGGAGILLYGIAWLTIPEDGAHDSAASELLRRSPQPVMVVGLILAGVVAGTTMMGTLLFSAPNPWPVMAVAAACLVGLVLFSRKQEPLPPPPADLALMSSGPMPPEGSQPVDDVPGTENASGSSAPTAALPTPPLPSHPSPPPATGAPGGPDKPTSLIPSPPPPPPPAPRRPSSRLLPVTVCLVLLAEGVIWIADQAGGGDVHPSVYPGTALGIIAAALLVGAWYGRSRLLILLGALATVATLGAAVIGPGPHGEMVYIPRTAANVADHYEHGAGELSLHLDEVGDVDRLDGRMIEIESRVGLVLVYVPTTIDATIHAEVTGGGNIEGLPDVEEFGHGSVESTATPVDDADPDVTIDVSLRYGEIEIRRVACLDTDTTGASNVPAACN